MMMVTLCFTNSDNLWSHFTTELELLRKNNDTVPENAKGSPSSSLSWQTKRKIESGESLSLESTTKSTST